MSVWRPEDYCLTPSNWDARELASTLYLRTFRTNFDAPGFAVVRLDASLDSVEFRRRMVELKRAMHLIYKAETGRSLVYFSASRFDQQTTTKPHLDGGPDECFLMLGYEPSAIDAELEILDYSQCAFEMGLSPQEFMARHNPIFEEGYQRLQPYATAIDCFARDEYRIVCVNNSSAVFSEEQPAWQGVLHGAVIPRPDETERRVVNSTMIASVESAADEVISAAEQEEFIRTSVVHRRGYDKPHLDE